MENRLSKASGQVVRVMLSALIFLAAACATGEQKKISPDSLPAMGNLTFPGPSIRLPLTARGGHPKVLVELSDGSSYPFIVDTGASVNVIDSALVEKLGFEVIGDMEIGAPGGNQVPGKIVRVPRFQIGAVTVEGAEFVVIDINEFSMGTMQGVLGLQLFENYLLAFDLAQGEIILSRDELSPGEPGVMPYDNTNGKVSVSVDVAGTQVQSHIDTGSMGEFLMPFEVMDQLPLKTEPTKGAEARLIGGARDIYFAQLDGDIRFAGITLVNPNLSFMSPSPRSGNIGSGVFGQRVMSIDQKNSLMSLSPLPDAGEVVSKPSPRRLGLGFRGVPGQGRWVVSAVAPDSLAATAGFRVDDELVSLNGAPAADYDMSKFGALFRAHEPLSFVVQRKSEKLTLEID